MLATEADFAQMFKDLIENSPEKVAYYFSPEATINLNGKELSYEEMVQRAQWMNNRTIKVQFEEALISPERAACVHYSSFNEKGKTTIFKVFSRIKLDQGKITRFEHMVLKISGAASYSVVNDF